VAFGLLGSIDANRGDPQNGWDTDQFPNSAEELTLALLEILRAGGFTTGGFNFDAKVRRQSVDAIDLLHGHIGAVDAVARALIRAAAILDDGGLENFRAQRYAGWDGDFGKLVAGSSLSEAADLATKNSLDPLPRSGRQEWLENLVNRI
jgi:xylose isomerase